MLQPADAVVLFAVICEGGDWTLRSLGQRLGVKHSKVQRSLERLAAAGLYDADRRQAIPHAAEEFIEHALKYLHPAHPGAVVRGIPTAWATSPLNREITTSDIPPVWPDPRGSVRGQAVTPLDDCLPALVEKWPDVAQLAALADAIRLGDTRSRAAAIKHLRAQMREHA